MDPNAGKIGLFNRKSPEELRQKLESETFRRKTISFYRYVKINDPMMMRDLLYKEWSELDCLGRIYVAREGINAQMNVPEHQWETFVQQLYNHPELNKVPFKVAVEDNGKSFIKLIIKVRQQIVADGLKEDEYDVTNVGTHLDAERWNEALEDPRTIVVDMRNHYESEVGRFQRAITPEA